jgi:hypothetical protein
MELKRYARDNGFEGFFLTKSIYTLEIKIKT